MMIAIDRKTDPIRIDRAVFWSSSISLMIGKGVTMSMTFHATHNRIMPITFGAFLIGAFSIIGLPPLGGAWSKFLLMMGAADAGHQIIIGVLMVSSLLNVAYLLPIVGRGFFRPATDSKLPKSFAEAPLLCWLPPAITAFGCLILFFYAGALQDFLAPIVGN